LFVIFSVIISTKFNGKNQYAIIIFNDRLWYTGLLHCLTIVRDIQLRNDNRYTVHCAVMPPSVAEILASTLYFSSPFYNQKCKKSLWAIKSSRRKHCGQHWFGIDLPIVISWQCRLVCTPNTGLNNIDAVVEQMLRSRSRQMEGDSVWYIRLQGCGLRGVWHLRP